MNDTTDHLSAPKRTLDALHQVMSTLRFQVVVERIRKQVKAKGEKRSKWIDTDRFSFRLFDGASVTLPSAEAQKVAPALTLAALKPILPWRMTARKHLDRIADAPMTLSGAKAMQEYLQTILAIDSLGYHVLPTSDTESLVAVRTADSISLIGDDRDMNAVFVAANKGLSEIMQVYQATAKDRLHLALADIA